jgi:AraC-like DNA-binding protein
MSSTRRLGSVRLDPGQLGASPPGASHPGADTELAQRVSGLLDRLGSVDGGRTLELWLVEVSPEQGLQPAHPPERARDAAGSTSREGRVAPRDGAVRRALELMERDVKARWTVASLAKAVGLSRAAFARRFSAALGASPIAHLTGLRLSRAARALSSGEAGVAEVAADVGYDSEFAFSRAFKRFHGVPPATFRRRQRLRVLQAGVLEGGALEVGVLEGGVLEVGVLEAGVSELVRLPLRVPPRCLALAA